MSSLQQVISGANKHDANQTNDGRCWGGAREVTAYTQINNTPCRQRDIPN